MIGPRGMPSTSADWAAFKEILTDPKFTERVETLEAKEKSVKEHIEESNRLAEENRICGEDLDARRTELEDGEDDLKRRVSEFEETVAARTGELNAWEGRLQERDDAAKTAKEDADRLAEELRGKIANANLAVSEANAARAAADEVKATYDGMIANLQKITAGFQPATDIPPPPKPDPSDLIDPADAPAD